MITASLQKAIDCLTIHDVYIRNLHAHCQEGFDPKYYPGCEELEVSFKHWVKEAAIVELEKESLLLRVTIDLGARWSEESQNGESNVESVNEPSESVKASIEAEFIAEYHMQELLDDECVDEFARKNASYHVWPYWREVLSNQCLKMYLPKIILPTMQLASNRHISRSK